MPTVELPAGDWEPRWYQFPLWNALQNEKKRRAIEIAHRRWGKDEVVLNHTAIEAHTRIGNYWHCFPEYAQARKGIWTAVNARTGRRRIDEAFPVELRESTNDSEMFIRFKSGSTWQVIGSDRFDSTVGAGPVGITYSEWALANPSAWAYHRPMVEENNGWAAFITTPRGRNHAKSHYDMAAQDPSWFAEISPISKTRALRPDQLRAALKDYQALYGEDAGRAYYEQEYDCSFNAAILGAFYAREMMRLRQGGRIIAFEPVPGQPVHRAWDLGFRDDTSIWWFQVIGGQPHIIDCYTDNGAAIDHYAEVCDERGWEPGIDFVPHDAAHKWVGTGRSIMEQMVIEGLRPQLVPNLSKLDGIAAARKTLKKAVFHPRCETIGLAALEQYRRKWDDEKKAFQQTEVHDWACHLADAFRYLSLVWREVPSVVEPPRTDWNTNTIILPAPPPQKRKGLI